MEAFDLGNITRSRTGDHLQSILPYPGLSRQSALHPCGLRFDLLESEASRLGGDAYLPGWQRVSKFRHVPSQSLSSTAQNERPRRVHHLAVLLCSDHLNARPMMAATFFSFSRRYEVVPDPLKTEIS